MASQDRKSTRLNSSHITISYAVFCLKKKTRVFRRLLRLGLPAGSHFPLEMLSVALFTLNVGALCIFFLVIPRPPITTLFPYTTLFRSWKARANEELPLGTKRILWWLAIE